MKKILSIIFITFFLISCSSEGQRKKTNNYYKNDDISNSSENIYGNCGNGHKVLKRFLIYDGGKYCSEECCITQGGCLY